MCLFYRAIYVIIVYTGLAIDENKIIKSIDKRVFYHKTNKQTQTSIKGRVKGFLDSNVTFI